MPYKALATQVLIYGLFALGFNLLYGYTGLLSFGHAAYWGLGAYGTGIALAKLKVDSLWLALGAGVGLRACRRGRDRLLLPPAARHLLRDAHARLCPAPLLHRLPPGRLDGRATTGCAGSRCCRCTCPA